MRLWGKIFKDNRMLQDYVAEHYEDESRTHKIFHCLEELCYTLDLGKPIWLDSTIEEFKRMDKVRFYQDNFIEQIPFEYFEIQILEE